MYMALCGGLSSDQALRLAQANRSPFLECPNLREWVAAVVARHLLSHHLALHQLRSADGGDTNGNAFVLGCCESTSLLRLS
jgi:hypothetical protein